MTRISLHPPGGRGTGCAMLGRKLVLFFASGAYLGYAPVASGTFGTLAGLPLAPVFAALAAISAPLTVLTFAALVALAIFVAGEAERLLGEADSGKIVIDEVAGYVAAVLFLPLDATTWIGGFLLFRLFDVWKPWPASWCERELDGGPGVVLDDVVAGLYANLVLRAIRALAGL